jgi:hypothetical protein
MTHKTLILSIVPFLGLAACNRAPEHEKADACTGVAGNESGEVAPCGEAATPATATGFDTRTDTQGRTVQVAGAALNAATTEIALVDLVARASELRGKTVKLHGHVAAMCHHKRGWFALVPDDPQGPVVRVLTAPAFLVPADAVGKVAAAEGVVDTIEVAAEAARHFAGEHKLGDPATIQGPVHQVVLRASGAEFM